MRLLDYSLFLPATNERRELLNQLRDIQEEYDNTLAPLLPDVVQLFAGQDLQSNLGSKFTAGLQRTIRFQGNGLDLLFNSAEAMRKTFPIVDQEIRRLFAAQFTARNITVNRLVVLRHVDAMCFYIRFIRRFLLHLVAHETAARGKYAPIIWTKAEVEWIEEGIGQFATLYPSMSLSGNDLKARFNQAAVVEVNPETFELASRGLNEGKMDPLRQAGFSPNKNPFVILGKIMAEWKHAEYKASQDEYFALQHRLVEMREVLAGNPASAVLQRQIKQYEERVSDYAFELAEIEERAREERNVV